MTTHFEITPELKVVKVQTRELSDGYNDKNYISVNDSGKTFHPHYFNEGKKGSSVPIYYFDLLHPIAVNDHFAITKIEELPDNPEGRPAYYKIAKVWVFDRSFNRTSLQITNTPDYVLEESFITDLIERVQNKLSAFQTLNEYKITL